jgi:hypothetical protein
VSWVEVLQLCVKCWWLHLNKRITDVVNVNKMIEMHLSTVNLANSINDSKQRINGCTGIWMNN